MKKFFFTIISILFLSFLTSFSHSQNSLPIGIYKLAGLWEMKNNEGIFYEYWKINTDSSLSGIDYTLNSNGDTIVLEKLQIIKKDSSVYYVATVLNHNDGKSIYFKMVAWTLYAFVFENKQHDFPQMITYSIKTPDLYNVIIEGPDEENKIKSIEFRFNRKSEY